MKCIHKIFNTPLDAYCVRDLLADAAANNWIGLPERIRQDHERGVLIFKSDSMLMNSDCCGWGSIDTDDFLVLWPTGVLGVFPRGRFELECEPLQ